MGENNTWKILTTLTVELETEVDAPSREAAFELAAFETRAHGQLVSVSHELLEVNGV